MDAQTQRMDYLLTRSIEEWGRVSVVLHELQIVIEKLSKTITPTTLPQMLTIGEVAELFQVTERTVRGWVESRSIPFQKIAGTVRFRLDELLACGRENPDSGSNNVVRLPRSGRLQPRKEQKHAS